MWKREIPYTCLDLEPKSIRNSKLFFALAYIFDKATLVPYWQHRDGRLKEIIKTLLLMGQ